MTSNSSINTLSLVATCSTVIFSARPIKGTTMLIRSNGFSQVIPLPTTRDSLAADFQDDRVSFLDDQDPRPAEASQATARITLDLSLAVADDPGASADAEQDADRGPGRLTLVPFVLFILAVHLLAATMPVWDQDHRGYQGDQPEPYDRGPQHLESRCHQEKGPYPAGFNPGLAILREKEAADDHAGRHGEGQEDAQEDEEARGDLGAPGQVRQLEVETPGCSRAQIRSCTASRT